MAFTLQNRVRIVTAAACPGTQARLQFHQDAPQWVYIKSIGTNSGSPDQNPSPFKQRRDVEVKDNAGERRWLHAR